MAQPKQVTSLNWREILEKIFSGGIPSKQVWSDGTTIISLLNETAGSKAAKAYFLSGGGGDLEGCKKSKESKALELNIDDIPTLVSPSSLFFFSNVGSNKFSFFFLETNLLAPSGVYPNAKDDEELTEIPGINYQKRDCWDDKSFQGQPLPAESRCISRIFKTNLVVFPTGSVLYDILTSVNFQKDMTAEEFVNRLHTI